MKQKATLSLLLVTIIWGCTFVWLKQALDTAESYSSGNQTNIIATLFVTLRFGLAIFMFFIFVPSIRKEIKDFKVWTDGSILALFMLGGFVFQMVGLEGISPAVSAFLTSLYVLFTALILAWSAGKLQSKSLLVGVILATFGAGFIQGPPQLHYDISEARILLNRIIQNNRNPSAIKGIKLHDLEKNLKENEGTVFLPQYDALTISNIENNA